MSNYQECDAIVGEGVDAYISNLQLYNSGIVVTGIIIL